ncbi:MAG TPA: cupredoxin domain-containing protein [Gemmatimonadales bacterium]|nr:cupredoxin domain-containing protein [Gemmatimonadales bacterium]
MGLTRLAGAAVVALAACHATAPRAAYVPRTRAVTVTTVPLLVKEDAKTLPFLQRDFAPGGVLEGHEVYAFEPSTITVVAGDTIALTFINPEDDQHSFVIEGLVVPLPPQQEVHATWVAPRPGIFPFVCSVPAHLPMMAGQVVVLAPAAFTP